MDMSSTLVMLAITGLYYGYQELKKPKPQRRTGLAVLFLLFGLAYLIWTFVAPTLGALAGIMLTQLGMVCMIAGGLFILIGLAKIKATKGKGKADAILNVVLGLALIAFGYFYYG